MNGLVIALLIFFGILLLLIEFLVAPGITVAGIGGLLLMGWGVYMSYDIFGTEVGHYVLAVALIAIFITMFFALRSKTWKRIMLNSKIDADVSADKEQYEDKIKTGDTGKALTRLNPIGKVMVNDIILEGKSVMGFIDENSEIEVVKVQKKNIIVKLK